MSWSLVVLLLGSFLGGWHARILIASRVGYPGKVVLWHNNADTPFTFSPDRDSVAFGFVGTTFIGHAARVDGSWVACGPGPSRERRRQDGFRDCYSAQAQLITWFKERQ